MRIAAPPVLRPLTLAIELHVMAVSLSLSLSEELRLQTMNPLRLEERDTKDDLVGDLVDDLVVATEHAGELRMISCTNASL